MAFNKDEYKKEIGIFIDYLNQQLDFACNEMDKGNFEPSSKLFVEKFTLHFRGASLELLFGVAEFNSILECLEKIKNETK